MIGRPFWMPDFFYTFAPPFRQTLLLLTYGVDRFDIACNHR